MLLRIEDHDRRRARREFEHAILDDSATVDDVSRDLRAKGWTAARVIGHAEARVGLVPEGRDLRAAEVSSIMSRSKEVQR